MADDTRFATEHDDRFARLRARAQELGCDLWADWTGSTVTGYRYSCAIRATSMHADDRGDRQHGVSHDRYGSTEEALVAAERHWIAHLNGGEVWDVAAIAAHARWLADETGRGVARSAAPDANSDMLGRARADRAVSVAVQQVCSSVVDHNAYFWLLVTTCDFHAARDSGAVRARWMLATLAYSVNSRRRCSARARAIAAVLAACDVDLADEGRTVRELRAFADILEPPSPALLAVLRDIERDTPQADTYRRHGRSLVDTVIDRGWAATDPAGLIGLTDAGSRYLQQHREVSDD